MVAYTCESENGGGAFSSLETVEAFSDALNPAIFHYDFAANGIEKLPIVFSTVHKS